MNAVPYTLTAVDDESGPPEQGRVPVGLFEARRSDGSRWLEGAKRWQLEPASDVGWLWPGKIPTGEVTVIEGEPGVGKSFVALDFVARVTAGIPWPAVVPLVTVASQPAPAQVLLVSRSDDDPTINRRLPALGADASRVARMGVVVSCRSDLETGERRPLEFPFDLPMLRHELEVMPSIRLVVIDPLSEFCETPKRLRKALRELNELAQEFDVAIVVTLPARCRFDVRGVLRVTSRFPTEVARSVWCVVADPDNPARRLFVARRTNSFVEPQGLPFQLHAGRVVWNPAVSLDPTDPLGQEAAIRDCVATLLEEGSRRSSEVFRLGAQLGFTPNQMRSVGRLMGVMVTKSPGFGEEGYWLWTLPGMEGQGGGMQGEDSRERNAETHDCGGEHVAWTSVPAQRSAPVLSSTVPSRLTEIQDSAAAAAVQVDQEALAVATESRGDALPFSGAAENSKIAKSLEKCGEKKECSNHRSPNLKEIRRKERKRRRYERRRSVVRNGRH